MSFQKLLQNMGVKLTKTPSATRSETIRSEIASFAGVGNVRKKANLLEKNQPTFGHSPTPEKRTEISDFPPEELAEVLVTTIQTSLDIIYLATREWAAIARVTGGTIVQPNALCSPGSVQPANLGNLSALKAGSLYSLPRFARDFANGLIDGYGMSFSTWLSSLVIIGPIFPVLPGESIRWPLSHFPQTVISEGAMKSMMLSAGAYLPRTGAQTSELSEKSLDYVAKVASGMLKYSISMSNLREMTAVGGVSATPGAPVMGATVLCYPGVFADIGDQLPNPDSGLLITVGGAVDVVLRENMVKAAYGRAGIEAPPRQ